MDDKSSTPEQHNRVHRYCVREYFSVCIDWFFVGWFCWQHLWPFGPFSLDDLTGSNLSNVIDVHMENRQSSFPLESIIGENMLRDLDEWDRRVRKRYLELAECSGLRLFEDCLHLHSRLLVSMVNEDPSFPTKFARPSTVQAVVAASAVGSFRNLRVAHKLLLEGYFSEMHNVLRMVEQWCECAVIVEAFPEAAQRIIEHGMEKKYIGKYVAQLKSANTEVGKLYKEMRTTFQILSQRAHPLQDKTPQLVSQYSKS